MPINAQSRRTIWLALSLTFGSLAMPGLATAEEILPTGSHESTLTLPDSQREIDVASYVPQGADAQTPIVFVLTGLKRNAEDYRDAWIDAADEYGFTIVVPRFSKQDYPGVAGYNLGNLVNAEGEKNPPEAWSYDVIDGLFTDLQRSGQSERQRYYLFGHSAGCQFVHRMLTFVPQSRVKAAICSAAGWWTLPDTDNEWPYGLKDAPVEVDRDSQSQLAGLNLLVTVGTQDTDPWHKYLRRSYQAMAQGNNRVERAWIYYKTAEQKANRYGFDFHWVFHAVPNVGHDNAGIAPFAAEQFEAFERDGAFSVSTPSAPPDSTPQP